MADYDSVITIGINPVLDEANLEKAESSLSGLREILSNAFLEQEGTEHGDIFRSALTSVEALSASVIGLKSIFKDLGSSLGGNVANAMNAVQQSISAMKKSVTSAGAEGFSAEGLNKILTQSLSFAESSSLINRLIQNASKDIGGWSQTVFSQKMPVLMSQIINPEIKKLSETAFVHDRPNFDRYVDALVQNNAVRRGLNYMSGSNMNTEQARASIERGLLMYNQRAIQSFGADAVAKTPYPKQNATIYPHDVIPEQFRAAYYGRGRSRQDNATDIENAFLATLPKQGNNYVSKKTYEALRNYVQENENGSALHDILKQAGIMSIENGNRYWAKHLTVAQGSILGGLSARELYNAKRGYTFYDADPNDSANDTRVDHRMSSRVQAQLALMDILSQDKRITPSTNYRLEDLDSSYVVDVRNAKNNRERIKGTQVTETGTPDQFVMPLTTLDTKSGQLVYRDPKWQKKTKLYEEHRDDQFAIMTDNPLVELVRQIGYRGKGGHAYGTGNGTFGYGRNDKGEAIYDTPPILKINTDQFYDVDKNGFDRTLNPEKEKQFRQILSGRRFDYGGKNYEYAYQGDSGVYMIESGLKKQIDDWYEARNLPSFFQGLNEGGLESIPEYAKLIKQINGMKKGSSTSQAYEDVFGALQGHGTVINRELTEYERLNGFTRDASGNVIDKNGSVRRDLNTRVANLSAWYKALGYSDQDIPDGAAFGNAAVFKNGPLQMRSAVGFGKYVLNPYNLESVFGAATAGFTAKEIQNMGESHGNNWLFSKGANDKVQVWIPSIAASEEDVKALQTGKLTDAQQKQFGSLAELRRQRFFVGNDENLDLVLTDKTAKQYQAFQYLSGKHYAGQYGDTALEQAKQEGRYDALTGRVTLLPHEQGEMHNRATPAYMVMRSAWDYANDPTIMSQQTAAAMGYDKSLLENSEEEFARRIYRLRTAEGRMDALKANPFYERMLKENPNFAYSSEATGYIEKQIRELEDKRLAGYVALPQTGENRVNASYRVAAITPGALIEPVLRAAGIDESRIGEAVQALLPSQMDKSKLVYTGNAVVGKGQTAQMSRDPDAAGQQIQVGSMFHTDDIRKVMQDFGVNDRMADQAIWFSQRQMGALNTGDFDGDTVKSYVGLPEEALQRAAMIQEKIKEQQKIYEQAKNVRDITPETKKQVSVEQAHLDALTRYYESTQTMGQASKILRESMNLPDSNTTKWSRIYEGMKLYDFASSDQRTKGLDPVISELGLETIKSGNSFERFLANMRKQSGKEDEDLKEAHLGRDIFKTDLPSANSPQGIIASIMRSRGVFSGESDYSDFKASMSKLMDMEYGDQQTPEAKAARWYSEQYGKTAFGRLLTRKDLAEGDNLAYQWLRSMNARNVAQDSDEYMQYNRFSKRLGRLRESDSMTYDNMVERAASLQSEYRRTGDENIRAKWAEAIANHDKYETDYTKLEQITRAEQANEEARVAKDAVAIQAAMQKAKEEEEAKKAIPNDVWNNPNVAANWSNFKNWIKNPITLSNVKQLSSSDAPIDTALAPILFDDLSSRIAVATGELYGQKDETDHIVIGNAMHHAFENYWKNVATGTTNGKTVDDYFTELVTGEGEYARKLAERGYKVNKTSREGQPERYEAVGPRGTGLDKLNHLLRTNENKGVSSLSDFVAALDKAGFDIEHPENIEGNFYKYDKNGRYQSVDETGNYEMKLRIPVLDASGKETGEYDETKTTHARPDLMLRNKKDNGLYVVDYKSRYEGAAESLVQSAFYTSVIDTLAKRAWTGVHESERDADGNLRKLTADEIQSLASFKQAGHLEKNAAGESVYVSDVKGAVGFDPRTRRSVLISREGENAQYFDEGLKLAETALANKMIDAKGLMQGGSAYMRAIMNEATISRQVENQLTSHVNDEGHLRTTPLEQKELDFFLSRYQADRDAIKGVRSAVYKELNQPERYFNRFAGYERQLKEALPDDVVSAVMQQYSRDGYVDMQSPVIQELSDEMKERARLLGQVQKLGIQAATADWEKAGLDVQKSLSGIGQTKTESTLDSVNRRIKQAESSREFLKTRMVDVTDENGNKTSVPVYQKYVQDEKGDYHLVDRMHTEEEQAQFFDTESDNKQIAAQAKVLKAEFLRSLEAQKTAEKGIGQSLDKFINEDAAVQDQAWSSLIGEVKDPSTLLSQALAKKAASAQKKIDEWNSEIDDWTEKLEKGDVSPSMRQTYNKLIEDRQSRIANAEKDIKAGRIDQAVLDEEKKRLGMTTYTPQQRAERWLNERLAIINQETQGSYFSQESSAALSRLQELNADPQSTLQEREAAEKAFAEAQEKNRQRNAELQQQREQQTAMYTTQAQALEEMYTRQETRPYEDFINRTNKTTLSRDERVQRQLDDMKAYAARQMINKDLSSDARQKWTDLLGNDVFWEQQKTQLTQDDVNQETLIAALQQKNQDKFALQQEQALEAMRRSNEDFYRQRAQATTVTSFGRNYNVYKNREIQLTRARDDLLKQEPLLKKEYSVAQQNADEHYLQHGNGKTKDELFKTDAKYRELSLNADRAANNYETNRNKLDEANNELSRLSGSGMMVRAAFDSASQAVGRLAQRFGRRLFMKAYQEAIQFVKQFDSAMTSIQMITLKTDEQMSTLGDGLIDKAKELKVSISDITKSAETLYRQGLSDDEVNDRLEVISKFSKVSGTKVDDATKLITIAMNTGLVTDASYAADVVTALGDNAATNAAQIEKGIEKAGAAAAADGTTFEELTAMLTAITSTTQIGGNVAGRTLNTIFGRMNKIGTNELITDENGNMISGSAVATLLKAQGVDTYDQNGNKRSSYDVLYDLAQKWEGMSDAEQQQIANAIAGTRQYSNFSAIMQGMTEGKVDEYMELAGNSSGVMDKKYEIYLKSLQASLTDLKNTFDSLINDIVSSGLAKDVVGSVTDILKGIDALINSGPGIEGLVAIFAALAVAIGAVRGGAVGAATTIAAIAAGGVAGTVLKNIGNNAKTEDSAKLLATSIEDADNKKSYYQNNIDRFKELSSKKDKTESEKSELKVLGKQLAAYAGIESASGNASDSIDNLSSALDDLAENADSASGSSKELADNITQEASERASQQQINGYYNAIGNASEAVKKAGDDAVKEYYSNEGLYSKAKIYAEKYAKSIGMDNFEFNEENLAPLMERAVKDFFSQDAQNVVSSMSELLADVSNNANTGLPSEYKNKDASWWRDKLKDSWGTKDIFGIGLRFGIGGTGGYGTISKDAMQTILETAEGSFAVSEGSPASQREGIRQGFDSVFKEFGVEEEDRKYVVEKAVNDYYSKVKPKNGMLPSVDSTIVESIIKEITGFDENKEELSAETFYENIDKAAKAGGKELTSKEKLAEQGLENPGNYGFYIGKFDNQRYTAEEVMSLMADTGEYKGEEYTIEEAAKKREANKLQSLNDELAKISNVRMYKAGGNAEDLYRTGDSEDLEALKEDLADYYVPNYVGDGIGYIVKAYKDTQGNIYSEDDILNFEKYGQEIFKYTDSSGKTQYGTQADLEKRRSQDYIAAATLALSSAGKLDEINAIPGEQRMQALKDMYSSMAGGMSEEEYYDLYGIDFVNESDLNKQEALDYKIAKDRADVKLRSREGLSKINGYQYGDMIYESVQEMIDDNIEDLISDYIKNVTGITDVKELSVESLAADLFEYKGEFYDSYDDAVEDAKKFVEEFYNSIEESIIPSEGYSASDFITVKNHFLSKANSGYVGWSEDSKNAYAINADNMLRMLTNENISDLQSAMDYVNLNDIQKWDTLYQNNEFARIMNQIQTDGHGNILNSVEDQQRIFAEVQNFLATNGRDYGATVYSATQQGAFAKEALSRLQNGAFVSQEAALAKGAELKNAEDEAYKRAYEEWESSMQSAGLSNATIEAEKAEFIKQYKAANPNYGKSNEEYLPDLSYLTDLERNYLKSTLGENLFQAVSEGNASPEVMRYAQMLINNKSYGIEGLTSRQKLDEITKVRDAIATGSFVGYDETVANAAMQGFGNWSTYAGLVRKQESPESLTEDELALLKEYEKEFEEFQKNAQVDVEIAGLQTLENANELLQGTVANIKALKQGGTVALEVVTKMRTEAYESGQQTAKLYSGKRSEQDEAAMAILGMSEDQFRQNREGNIQQAKQYQQQHSAINAASYKAERESYGDLKALNTARMMRGANVDKIDAQIADIKTRQATLDQINASRGYFWNEDTQEYDYDPSRIKINYVSAETRLENDRTVAAENNLQSIYQWYGNGLDLTDKQFNQLYDSDEMYKGMLLAGAPEADVRAYAQRMAQGQKGTFAQNYGWALTNAFGENWQNGEFDLAFAQRWYKEVMTGNNREFYENMFGQMENGEQWMKLLSGEITGDTTQLEEDLAKGLVRDRFEAEFAGYRNKDQMVENAVNLAEGTYAEQQQAASSYYSQLANVSKAQYALGSGLNNESNRSAIASLLEIDDQQVKTLMSTEAGRDSLYKMIQEKSQNVYSEMIKVFTEAFDLDKIEGLNLDGVTDLESLLNELYAAWETADGEQKEHIEQMIAMAEEAANAADASNSADFVAARDRVLEKTSENANNAQATAWFSNYLENSFGEDQEYYGESNGNIELNHRPKYWNTDDEGNITGYSTEDSITIWDESKGAYAVIPTIVNGNRYNTGQAIQHYYESDEHLGTFESLADAEGYSQNLHLRGSYFHDDNLTERERQIESMYASATLAGYDADALFNEHPELVYASEMYKNNEMDFGGLKTIFDTAALGSEKDYGYYNSLQQALFGDFVDSNGHFNINETNQDAFLERYTNLQQSETGGKELLQEYESYIPNLNKAMKSLKNGSEDAAEGINDVNKEVDNNKSKQLQRYGDYADDAAQSFKNLTNGGKTTVKELAAIKKRMEDLQDVNTAVGKASGKSGKQLDKHTREILANYLGIDADTLKDYSKEELADALTGVQDAVNEEFNETTFEPVIQAGLADINAALDKGEIDYEVDVKPIFNADGTINMDSFVALLQKINSQYASVAESMAGHVLTYMIRALQTTNADGSSRIDVDSTVTSSALKTGGGAYNGYNSKGSSSGGSGKSDTDKTIEKVENRETKAKHKVTMAQLVQEHYGFTNEYQNQINAIYDEVSAQKGLLDVYKDNLSLLEAQQNAVTKYSDDWWTLEKQILSTQESIQETKNTIESLDSKVIEVVTAKQENEDRPYTHTRNMIDSYVDRYSTIYESGGTMSEAAAYNKWVTNKNLQTDSIRQQINQNKEQIAEWQDLLSKIDENNDNYETVKDNIWALQEENAELENELLSQEIELNEARLSRIAQVLQNTNSTYEHEINMSDTHGQIYQINRDYSGYRQELANQRANYKNQVKPYQDAITSIREQMATLTPYSAAWYSARDSLYEYEEALEQLSLSIEETDQALRESYLNELFENIDKVNTAAEYRMTGLQEKTRTSKLAGDNKNYVKNLDKERLEIVKEITEQQNALDDLINLKNSGKIKKGTAEWDELLNKIKEVQNNMSKLENDAAEKYQDTAAASLQGIVDKYSERTRDTNHAMDILKTQESEYRSSGEYTNLKTNLNVQYDLEKQRSKELKTERKELVKELSRYDEGSFEYNNVLKQIQSVDKELATSNNTLKSLKKSADEVDKQMLKATASYENYVHNMYKSIVQQQKDQLNATVSMQNTVLEAIKKSYQEQWNLIKKDIDKKKQALQEEKNIIQERLNARKQAEQQTDKEEQLAKLQKQLMIIEADPTRTKEAKELRKQIDDLQKELSGNLADSLASAETKRIDDAIKGMSQYESNTEEDMNDYLKDANNFKTVFDNLFSGSEEAFYEFMQEINASDMKNKTAEQIEQLKNGWHDQWLKMNGEVETYWEEVASSIKITEDNRKQVRKQLLKLLKQTNAYKSAGEAGRQQQIAEIDDYIESAINAKKVSAEAGNPTIAILGDTDAKIEELKSNTYKTLLDESAQAKLSAIANAVTGSKKYIGGGLVNYTGIARVDGTPSRPEAFLDAEDTANIRAMLDQFNYVKTMPFMSHIDGGMFGGTSNSIGDVNITINQAELSSDQDIEALAGKVGQAFTRELSKRGFNTASYAF